MYYTLHTAILDLCQVEPRRAVDYGKHPAAKNDLFGSRHPADELGLDGVTNGDVALHCEGC